METLEELKSIIAGAPEGATLYDGEYFKFENDEYHRWSMVFDIQGWNIDLDPSCEVRSLSDIGLIIELMEQLNKIESVKEECAHPSTTASYTHVTCDSCCMIRTDGGWGCASRKWFDNIESAKFYEKNGFLPK